MHCIVLICLAGIAGAEPEFAWEPMTGKERTALVIRSITAKEMVELTVQVKQGDTLGPPLSGIVTRAGDRLTFAPRFRFRAEVDYRVTLKRPGFEPIVRDLRFAAPHAEPTTRLTRISPSAGKIPENTLRFYLHFSAPMERGSAYDHIKLVRDDGVVVATPFLELPEELWDPAQQRLTLLCDPGRVKRGLKPREEDGPILEEGRSYTLLVDRAWRDAEGRPLLEAGKKTFQVTAPVEGPFDPKDWMIVPPKTATREPLTIRFSRPVDESLALRCLTIRVKDESAIEGTFTLGKDEIELTFLPKQPWRSGEYRISIETILEDICGNRIDRPFEVDLLRPIPRGTDRQRRAVPFAVH